MSKITFVFIALFLIILPLIVFQVALNVSPIAIGQYFIAQIGSGIGVSVSVPPNPFNALAQQLQEKEETLLEKEINLVERENLLTERIEEGRNKNDKTLNYLSIIGGVLLTLILLNFYFDYRRRNSI